MTLTDEEIGKIAEKEAYRWASKRRVDDDPVIIKGQTARVQQELTEALRILTATGYAVVPLSALRRE